MNDEKLHNPNAIKTFLVVTDKVEFPVTKELRYEWIAGTLKRAGYYLLKKNEKVVIREYLLQETGYSRAQIPPLIQQYKTRH